MLKSPKKRKRGRPPKPKIDEFGVIEFPESPDDESAAWHDCHCQVIGCVLQKCQSGMFAPFDPLPCGLSIEKLIQEPRKQKESRFCLECGRPTKRSDYCSKCANRLSRERRFGSDVLI